MASPCAGPPARVRRTMTSSEPRRRSRSVWATEPHLECLVRGYGDSFRMSSGVPSGLAVDRSPGGFSPERNIFWMGICLVSTLPLTGAGTATTSIMDQQPHSKARTHATATITVTSSQSTPYDQTASPALIELRLNETFTGDIEG